VDTIGAGDTLDAAFLFARLELGLFGAAALDFANAAAARSILFTGGYGAQSSYDDIMRFLESNGELQ
jgi:sugar/nucleoside kinase (ribokinase family)